MDFAYKLRNAPVNHPSGNGRNGLGMAFEYFLRFSNAAIDGGLPVGMRDRGSLGGFVAPQRVGRAIEAFQVHAARGHLCEQSLLFRGIRIRQLYVFADGALEIRTGFQLAAEIEPEGGGQ